MSAGKNDDGSVTMSSPEEDLHSERTKQEKSDSPTSHLSLESGRSVDVPLNFSDEAQRNTESTKQEKSDSPTSHLSLESGRSVDVPLNFSDEAQRNTKSTKQEKSDSPTSHLSLESGRSVDVPLNFSDEAQRNTKRKLPLEDTEEQVEYRPAKTVCQQHYGAPELFWQEHHGHSTFYIVKSNVPDSQTVLVDIMGNMGTDVFKTFKRELSEDYPECLGNQPEELSISDAAEKIMESFGGEAALRITFHFLSNVNPLQKITDANKAKLKNKCQNLNEGNSSQGKQSLLKDIYTDLYMTDGGSGEINNEHEVLRIEVMSQIREEALYSCNDIFKTLPERKQIKTVLTMGIAGIGKHVSVQKFILDWADGKTTQDIEVIIHLPFRDLNQKKEDCSLLQLIQQYVPEVKEENLSKLKMLFILDGLDLCQHPLDFHKNDSCSDINKKVPVDVLLTNLIKGNLLPFALLWITTRPSTANRIPPECVHRVTEIRGFNDHQKEAYFRKKISDQKLASEIIAHIKSCQSLYIMCHMPIFCWISATVLENMMSDGNSDEIPKTLTEMFTHFLLIQISLKHKKFNGTDASNPKKLSEFDKTLILKLGELAFQQMEKHNFIFKEEDLINYGIDAKEVTEYSVCTEIFREELGLYREKVYSFVHASYQEYLAAIYAHFACVNDGKNVLEKDESTNLSDVHESAVDKALKSKNGHLDLFLRFLLGLSVDPNCTLLQDLLTKGSSCKPCVDKNMTVHYIKEKLKQEQSPERIINLFHCLNELNDNSLVKEIQTAMKSGTLLGSELEPEQWSALAYVLLKSGELLDEFDMKKFNTSTENQIRLLPVLRICKIARLDCCNLSLDSCERVATAFQSFTSPLRELDLSNNKLDKSGVTVLMAGLTSAHCQLHTLGLSGCNFQSESCTNLASALKSKNSSLTELDLSYNKISEDGIDKLCDGLISQNCKLQKLKLKRCGLTKASCGHLASVLKLSYSHLKELELKSNDLQDAGVKKLSSGLQDPQCKLEKLGVDKGGECRMKPGLSKYACQLTVDLNTVHPRLKLSEGKQKISETTEEQKYPDHPERFKLYPQAMCTEALTGRCYFEVECDGGVGVGVAYKTSDRKDNIMGVNNAFPALLCQNGKSKLWQNNEITCAFPVIAQSKRIGVYVDLKSDVEHGSLSYYSICNGTCSHLHTYHAKFKGPLYTGFILLPDSSVTLCKLT